MAIQSSLSLSTLKYINGLVSNFKKANIKQNVTFAFSNVHTHHPWESHLKPTFREVDGIVLESYKACTIKSCKIITNIPVLFTVVTFSCEDLYQMSITACMHSYSHRYILSYMLSWRFLVRIFIKCPLLQACIHTSIDTYSQICCGFELWKRWTTTCLDEKTVNRLKTGPETHRYTLKTFIIQDKKITNTRQRSVNDTV